MSAAKRPLPHERLSAAIRAGTRQGPAIVAFLTAGFPSREQFGELLRATASEADAVEIGVPFTDPMADGVTIQRSSHVALAQGVSLRWILEELERLGDLGAPILLMSYLNPLLAFGLDRLPGAAARSGVAGFIVPDLPYEESAELREALQSEGIALIQMVTPVTADERLAALCRLSQGFVYAVTMTGTTGKAVTGQVDLERYLDRVRAASSVPVCAGFGIRSREQIVRIGRHADGVIVGSALVEALEQGKDPGQWLADLRGQHKADAQRGEAR